MYGNEVQSGCKIIANGSNEAGAVVTVDYGQDSCTSGKSVTLHEGSIIIGGAEVVSLGTAFKDIIFAMTNCNDEVFIVKTHAYTAASSIEVLGYGGNDRIEIGDGSLPLDDVFGNIILDGGRGYDSLLIRDQGSSTSKSISVHPTIMPGVQTMALHA